MQAKVWYTSKTLWFNAVTFTLGILALTQFGAVVPITWLPYIALGTAIGNLALRTFFTEGPVTVSTVDARMLNQRR